jgi:hypothetical protein
MQSGFLQQPLAPLTSQKEAGNLAINHSIQNDVYDVGCQKSSIYSWLF